MHKIRLQVHKKFYRYIPAAVPAPQWTRSSHCSTDSGSPFSLARPNRIKFKGKASSYRRLVVTLKKRVKGAPILGFPDVFFFLPILFPLRSSSLIFTYGSATQIVYFNRQLADTVADSIQNEVDNDAPLCYLYYWWSVPTRVLTPPFLQAPQRQVEIKSFKVRDPHWSLG